MRQTSKFVIAVLLGHISSAEASRQPIGAFEAERDNDGGYPSNFMGDTHKKFVNKYINKSNGAFNTQWQVDQADAAEAEADLKEASQKTKFKVPQGMIVDWTGDKFVHERPYCSVEL